MFWKASVLAVAAAAIVWATPGRAAGVIIGPLCLDGVVSTAHPERATPTATGRWVPHEYRLSGAGRLVVFDKPIPESDALETCAETEARVAALGLKATLAGRLSALKLSASLFTGTPSNRVQIDRDAFSATLVAVEKGAHPLLGGTIDFSGSKAWIGSSARVVSQADGIEGEFWVEVWNRTIQNVLVALPGGSSYRADLRPRNVDNETLRLDLASGVARLWNADLSGTPAPAQDGDWALSSVAAQGVKATATTLQVRASGGAAEMALLGIKGTADTFEILTQALSWHLSGADMTIDALSASATQKADSLAAAAATLRNAAIKSAAGSLTATGGELVKGPVALNASLINATTVKAASAWKQPTSDPLSPMFPPSAISLLQLSTDGGRDSPSTALQMETTGVTIGGLGIERALRLVSGSSSGTLEIVLPVDIKVPATGGSVKLTDQGHELLLTGRLDKLQLTGRLVIPLTALDKTRLEVPKSAFQLSVGAAVAVSPFIAGAKPNFGSGALAFSNFSDLVVARQSTGVVLAHTDLLLLTNPVLQLGELASRATLAVDLRTDAGATLLYDLAQGRMVVGQAKLRLSDTSFALAGPAPHVLDISGDQITEPRITLGELLIDVDLIPPARAATARLANLDVSAEDIRHVRPPGESKGPAYRGHLSGPFHVGTINAAQLAWSDRIVFQQIEVGDVRFGLDRASAEFGDGTSVADGTIALALDKVAETKVGEQTRRVWTNGRLGVSGDLSLNGPDFALNGRVPVSLSVNVSGREDALAGSGSMKVDAFSGNARSRLQLDFKCDNGAKLEIPMEYNFASGGGTLDARFDSGELSANGSIAAIAADAHTVGVGHGCNGPKDKFVVAAAQRGWTDGICTQVFPPKAWACRWEWSTPEVSFGYHIRLDIQFAHLATAMTNPRMFVRPGRTSFCNVGVVQTVAPVIAGGFAPQIDTAFGGSGEEFVNAIIAANFEAPQTMVASGIANGAGWLASSTATPLGNLLCIGKPL